MEETALLENNFLSAIRTVVIFFVAAIALFNFTNLGKDFSIISICFAIILLISIEADYFIERYRLSQSGFFPRTIIDIIAFTLIAVVCFLIWLLYTIWNTEQTSLSDLAKEVEKEVRADNRELIKNVKEIEEKIILTNKDLIDAIRNINNPNYVPPHIPIAAPPESSVPGLVKDITGRRTEELAELAAGELATKQQRTVNDALLATVA